MGPAWRRLARLLAASLTVAATVAGTLAAAPRPNGEPPDRPPAPAPDRGGRTEATADGKPAAEPPAVPALTVEELVLDNGMRFLFLPRPGLPTVAAGWVVRSGAASDPVGASGAAHLLEHLLFQGSETVGARDVAQEKRLLAEEDRLWNELRQLHAAGDDASRRFTRLAAELESVRQRARALTLPGELSLLYAEAGATGLDALTHHDFSLYHVTLPAGRLELWFWLESDRLLRPVLRELAREKSVLLEERRQRVEATPTGLLDEALLQRLHAPDGPYSRPDGGRPADILALSRQALTSELARRYRPDRITAALVGGFSVEAAERLARRYFDRLAAPQPTEPPAATSGAATDPPTAHAGGDGERLYATCDCPPRARVLYPTVAFGHPDAAALDALAGLLNGRTGRLYRSLVRDQEIAFAAWAVHSPLARAGHLSIELEPRPGIAPEDVVAAWDREVRRLAEIPPAAGEIERSRNRLLTDSFLRLRDPAALMRQLLVYEALGDWRHLERWPARIWSIDGQRLATAARRYLEPSGRIVAIYRRGPTSGWRSLPATPGEPAVGEAGAR